jgi:hypothetical protein
VYKWGIIGALLVILSIPIKTVYGINVSGLSIEEIAFPLYSDCPGIHHIDSISSEVPPYLDSILKNSYFPRNSSTQVSLYLPESDTINLESDTNTDEEGRDENYKENSTDWITFQVNDTLSSKKYLLTTGEVETTEGSFTKNLCAKLARDAYHISNNHTSSSTRLFTTCFCVVLLDKNGRAKKFVFHNGKEKMNTTMEQKAQELGYAIKTGYQAHAEGAFLQFLLQRSQQNEERYTHILGMGCSRMHCQECNCLLKLFLGRIYYMFTAAMQDNEQPAITNTQEGCTKIINAEIVYKNDAIKKGNKKSPKYYLPQILQDHIRKKTGLCIDFSTDRFVIKNEDTMVERRQRSDKKRRASILPSA